MRRLRTEIAGREKFVALCAHQVGELEILCHFSSMDINRNDTL